MLKQCPLVCKLIFYSELYDLFSIGFDLCLFLNGLFSILVAAATRRTSVKKPLTKPKPAVRKLATSTAPPLKIDVKKAAAAATAAKHC